MNENIEKSNRFCFITAVAAFILVSAVIGIWAVVHTKNKPDNRGIAEYQQRERELLARIAEYQQREEDRITREARRIEAEGERIKRTEAQLGAIRGLDRRSGDLLSELAQEVKILADFFVGSRSEYSDAVNNNDNRGE